MKTLYQSLLDYEMALLQAIAHCRGVPLTTPSKHEAVALLAETLLSPGVIAIALADLSGPEKEALQFVAGQGGRVETPRFTRQYGAIRPMGAARLEREQPWQNPANPAEGLWYRGLIFKTFQITTLGSVEVVYIPDDMLPLLEMAGSAKAAGEAQETNHNLQTANGKSFSVSQLPIPAVMVSGEGRGRENMFNLLVHLQTNPVRVDDKLKLNDKDLNVLLACLLPALHPTFALKTELEFLLHLGQRAGLLMVAHNRLKPDRDPTRAWLQKSAPEQTQFLQNTWRADPTWNDLWHTPGLIPQPTGWENSPLLARSKILACLSQLAAAPETWYSLDDFVAAIKRVDPDFQRPTGDYDSWYIQDPAGQLLMGFEHWDRVEGALIRHTLTHLLPALGVLDLGLPADAGEPVGFRLTAQGYNFLLEQPAAPPLPPKAHFWRVDDNFQAHLPDPTNLLDRFQLARFAWLERYESGRVIYRITQASVGRALRNGVTADQMVAFLARVTNNRTPLKVVETLRTWGARQDTAKIEHAALLRLKHKSLVEELRQNANLRPLLGEAIGPTTILIPSDNVAEVRRILTELGYLE
ncbi:MAG: helicase-associated domain-containing protein [Anaerolineae bacterium]|nr:helicase-associated domain-containing protein [Anaerolineae bacterium]